LAFPAKFQLEIKMVPCFASAFRFIAVAVFSHALIACGSGGTAGGDSEAAVERKLKENAMEIRLASTLLEVGSMGTNYIRSRVDSAYLEFTYKAEPVTTDGCVEYGAENPDAIASAGDNYFYKTTNCVFAYKADPVALTQSSTGKAEIVELSNANLPVDAPWRYEDRLATTSKLKFRLDFAGKIKFNGERTDSGLVTQISTGHADGSQIDKSTAVATSRELSDFGLSEVTISSGILCKYAAGVSVNGDCSASTGNLIGTIYGVAINASMRQLPGLPETHEISYGDKKLIVTIDKIEENRLDSQFSMKSSSGDTFVLTGKETSILRLY
jgi:hypothetical protein